MGEPPTNRLILCKFCDKSTGGTSKPPLLLNIPTGSIQTGDESQLSPLITPLHEIDVEVEAVGGTNTLMASDQTPVTISDLNSVAARIENTVGGLIGQLTGKVENALARLTRSESQIAALHAENTALTTKVDDNFAILSARIDALNAELPDRISAINPICRLPCLLQL